MAEATGSVAAVQDRDPDHLASLMARYQNADREAASELVRRLSPMLLRFLAGPAQTRGHSDDMLQECWLRIHRARHTYRPGAPVLPWIFAIARHTRVDVYRRRRRIDAREVIVEEFSDTPAESPQAERTDAQALWQFVERLPASQKDVIRMLKVTGMSLEEVARATGTSVGAVKQKAHRAYQKLRVMLSDAATERGES